MKNWVEQRRPIREGLVDEDDEVVFFQFTNHFGGGGES